MLFGKKKEVRKATINRKTNEVDIKGELVIDGRGKSKVVTGFEPLNHLLTLFSFHGLFDLNLKATGDLQHHIIEDIGIALGKAFKVALGDKTGINRYGSFSATMDKVVVEASIDISGRPVLYKQISAKDEMVIQDIWDHSRFDDTSFTSKDAEEFLEAFTQHAGISLVYNIKSGEGDLHHLLEALFKAMGKALDQATQIDPRRKGVPSTKGIID
tara:strand:+ start:74 stop:715 length:642 start_codon:yes stop_codon:yes gene_type:complete